MRPGEKANLTHPAPILPRSLTVGRMSCARWGAGSSLPCQESSRSGTRGRLVEIRYRALHVGADLRSLVATFAVFCKLTIMIMIMQHG